MTKKKTPTLKRHKRSGNAYAHIAGRQEWFGPYDEPETHQRFAERVARWLAGGDRMHDPHRPLATLHELAARFLEHAEVYYRLEDGRTTSTVASYAYALRPLLALFGSQPTADFTVQHLKLVREAMIEAGLARKTINNRVTLVVHVFRWGTEEGLVPGGLFQSLEALRPLQRHRSRARETEPRRPVAWEAVAACLPYFSRQVAAIVQVMWWSGMRPAEAVALRPADLDTSGELWEYRPRHHKTLHHGRERLVVFGTNAQEVLRPFLSRVPPPDPARAVFSPQDAEAERNLERRLERVTPLRPSDVARKQRREARKGRRQLGEAYTVGSLRRAVERACERAGIERWTPHQLRHAAATRIRREEGIEAAKVALGHASLATTEIYAEVEAARLREIMAKHG